MLSPKQGLAQKLRTELKPKLLQAGEDTQRHQNQSSFSAKHSIVPR